MRTLILLLLISCGKPLIPNKIEIDAPENIQVTHKVELQLEFVSEYCDTISGTNEDLNKCIDDFLREVLNQ